MKQQVVSARTLSNGAYKNTEIFPMYWIDYVRIIFPRKCKATGERLGWFSKAYRWTEEVEYRGEVITNNVYWYSESGFRWLKLQGKA